MAVILTIDDSPSMRQMVSCALKGAGHDVIEALHGQDGLDKAKATKVDLILSDVNMPVMNGIKLVEELRALPEYKSVPILMLTTESTCEKKAVGKATGATDWIMKPFFTDDFIATINIILP